MKVSLAKLSGKSIDSLAELLPPYWTRKNPIDLGYAASPELYAKAIKILAKDPEVANVLVMYAPSLTEDSLRIADAVVQATKGTRLNVFTCWLGQSTVLDARDEFYRAGLPSFFNPEKAVMAFMQHVRHQRVQRLLTETPESFTDHLADHTQTRRIVVNAIRSGRAHLSNQEARDVIRNYGINAVETMYCDDMEEVLEVFAVERRPVDITLIHEQACHPLVELSPGQRRYKGTVQKLNSEGAIMDSCRFLMDEYQKHYPDSGFLGFAVQRSYQHVGGIEFSVGITRDKLFGPLVVCGASGAHINVMTDRQIALPPLNMVLARELLRRTYMYKLLPKSEAVLAAEGFSSQSFDTRLMTLEYNGGRRLRPLPAGFRPQLMPGHFPLGSPGFVGAPFSSLGGIFRACGRPAAPCIRRVCRRGVRGMVSPK